MVRIFNQNAILVGMVDNFCLVCETYLRSEQDIDAHIAMPVHRKQIEAIPYVDEYKNDGIKKIKNKYFCELCNKLLTALPRVKLHISEQTHMHNKNISCLQRVGNLLTAFGKVVISDQSWQGLNDNSCTTCNMDYENEETHKNLSTHILNVIQTVIEIDNDQNIYRRIDEVSFHCLTCNMVLELNSLTTHFDGDYHKKLYQACCDAYNKTQAVNVSVVGYKPEDQDINKTPDDTQAENLPVLCEIPKNQEIKKSPDDTQAENVPLLSEKSKEQHIRYFNVRDKFAEINKGPIKEAPKNFKLLQKAQNKVNKKKKRKADIYNQKSTNGTNNSQENVSISENVCVKNEEDKIFESLRCKNYITRDEDGNYWCILCDWICEPGKTNIHRKGKHHQILLGLHRKRLQINTNDQEETLDSDSDDILERLDEFQNFDFKINFELNIAYCKKCKTHVELVSEVIESHILEHKKIPVEKEEIPNAFGYTNNLFNITRNIFPSPVFNFDDKGNNNESTSSNIKSVLKHNDVDDKNETSHTKKSALKCNEEKNRNGTSSNKKSVLKLKCNEEKNRNGTSSNKKSVLKFNDDVDDKNKNAKEYKSNAESKSSSVIIQDSVTPKTKKPKTVNLIKVAVRDFLQNTLVTLKPPMSKDVIINNRYCINYCSFLIIVHLKAGTHRCNLCDEDFQISQLYHHCNSSIHFKAFIESLMIVNDDSEFIREFRAGFFHCGFCNTVEKSWENMEEHLKSSAHKESKNLAIWHREICESSVESEDYEHILCDNNFINEIIKCHS